MKFKRWLALAIDVLMIELQCGMTVTIREEDYANA